MTTFGYEHHRLLGTVIDVRVSATDELAADGADQRVVSEIVRLERVFSAFDEASELCRWRRGEPGNWSKDFVDLMGRALGWQVRSGGAFNPLTGELSARWEQAVAHGMLPIETDLAAIAGSIKAPRFEVIGGVPVATGDCSRLNLHAIAKGYIVDRALDVAVAQGVAWVSVNAGGDLAHRGAGSIRAGIENPHRPYDNQPPLVVVELANAAVATSGSARRGFRVAGRWFGHVLNPRTGWPVQDIASISVVASDVETADALSTVAGVLAPVDAVAYLDGVAGVEGLVIDRDRLQWVTQGWADRTIT